MIHHWTRFRFTFASAARALLLAAGAFAISSCSTHATFRKAPLSGHFEGDPHLVWIAPNTFLFYQPPGQEPFSFTTHKASEHVDPSAPGRGRYQFPDRKIVPGMMITTGASVPRNLWRIQGMAPWDYAQAAIIHDWIFEAHHRHLAGEKGYEKYADIGLGDAADIFTECIRKNMYLGGRRTAFIKSQERLHPGDPAWQGVREVFPDNKESPFELWAYHYAVSPDCIAPNARKLWETRNNDIEVCRAILATKLGSREFRRQIEELMHTSERITLKLDALKKTKRAKLKVSSGVQLQSKPVAAQPAKKAPAGASAPVEFPSRQSRR